VNIVDAILFQCRQSPPKAALCAPGAALNLLSYARLECFIHNIGRRALAAGIQPGNVAAILVKDHILHASILFALARIGVATLSVGHLNFPKGLRVDAVLTDSRSFSSNPTNSRIIPIDLSWTEGDGHPVEDRFVSSGGEAIARIALTSGSTGESKALAISHDMQMRRIWRYAFAFGNSFLECSRFFSDMGLGSHVCFRLMVYVLWRGGMFFFPGEDPMDTLQSFDLYKVQGLNVSTGGLGDILKFYEENRAFRSQFSIITSTGSPMHNALSERARARLCANLMIHYGSAEMGTVSTAPADILADIPGSVGRVVPGVNVNIVDVQGQTVPMGAEGILRIRSSTTVNGYLGDPERTKAAFHDGYFHTGDLGYISKDGLLVISGRESDALNLGGEKIKPQAVEEVLTTFKSVDQAAVFSAPNALGVDEIWALIVPNAAIDEKILRAHCEQRLAQIFRPVRYVTVEQLPRNENGKIERHRLREFADAARAPKT